jgi:putative transcriptional regulator
MPLLLSVEKAFAKVRNLKYRYLQDGTIFPTEVTQYEPFSIREALNNCIAHQDYTKAARINLIEFEDRLVFTNYGTFIPESVEKVVLEDAPEETYRNPFLARAMFNLKMVDTVGGGIKKMFNYQRARFFPMPEYDISGGKVKMTLIGKVLDVNYAQRLAKDQELTLEEIIMLDKVQKHKKLSLSEEKYLKKKHLIEGRKPNFFICKEISQKTGQKADYSKNKGMDKQYYLDFILNAIKDHGNMSRADIDKLLWDKLPDILDEKQKKNKIGNLLTELRKSKRIKNIGSFTFPSWTLA